MVGSRPKGKESTDKPGTSFLSESSCSNVNADMTKGLRSCLERAPTNQMWDRLNNKKNDMDKLYSFFFFFFLSFVFGGSAPMAYEVPRLGIESELQLPAYTTATPDPSRICDYTTAYSNAGSLTHRARPGIKPAPSWFQSDSFPLCHKGECLIFFFF